MRAHNAWSRAMRGSDVSWTRAWIALRNGPVRSRRNCSVSRRWADSREKTLSDAGRVAGAVLRAVLAVVPVEHVEAPIRPHLQRYRHEPHVVRGQQVRFRFSNIRRAVALQSVDVEAAAVDVADDDPVPQRRREVR